MKVFPLQVVKSLKTSIISCIFKSWKVVKRQVLIISQILIWITQSPEDCQDNS